MSLVVRPVLAAISSHVAAGGHCNNVTGHEPKHAPGGAGEITAAVWFDAVVPRPGNSSLNTTGVVVTIMVRLYQGWTSDPVDEIDPRMVDAMQDLMERLDGDFTLGGVCDYVDLLGETGTSLSSKAGYVEIDRALQRVIDITVPVVMNDVWTQAR